MRIVAREVMHRHVGRPSLIFPSAELEVARLIHWVMAMHLLRELNQAVSRSQLGRRDNSAYLQI